MVNKEYLKIKKETVWYGVEWIVFIFLSYKFFWITDKWINGSLLKGTFGIFFIILLYLLMVGLISAILVWIVYHLIEREKPHFFDEFKTMEMPIIIKNKHVEILKKLYKKLEKEDDTQFVYRIVNKEIKKIKWLR